MPNKTMITTLELNGEKEFKAALDDLSRSMKLENSALRALASEFEVTDDKQAYFAKRSEVLSQKLSLQEAVVNELQAAMEKLARTEGHSESQLKGLQIELNYAIGKMNKMKVEATDAEKALNDLGKSQIEADFKDAIDEATRSLKLSQSEAKLLGVTYRNNAQDSDYLAKKSENLRKQISSMEKIYIDTAEAVKRSADETGDLSENTVDLKIRMNNARIELTNLRRELDTTNQQMADLGRDSEKVGRQLERGIGDAAEDVEDKLDGMFAKVASDVNALKGSVAFQTTMSVGEFVMDGINSVVNFVNENQEYNRKLSQTMFAVEAYGLNREKINKLLVEVAAFTGDEDAAFEAITNLSAVGFESEEQMEAAVKNLLGVFLSSGGALSIGSLAEDFLETVATKSPTGTFAEAVDKFTERSAEDVKKSLEQTKSREETIEAAMSFLTESGSQTKYEDYAKKESEFLDAKRKQVELTQEWAELAEELQPAVTSLTDKLIWVVDKTTGLVKYINEKTEEKAERTKSMWERFLNLLGLEGSGKLEESGEDEWNQVKFGVLIPGAGAEELTDGSPTNEMRLEWGSLGKELSKEYAKGIIDTAGEKLPSIFDDPNLKVDYSTTLTDAETAGKDLSIKLANGITVNAGEATAATMKMVDDINAILDMIAVPNIQFSNIGIGGYGTGMPHLPNITLAVDGNAMGKAVYDGVSSAGGRAVQTTMLVR